MCRHRDCVQSLGGPATGRGTDDIMGEVLGAHGEVRCLSSGPHTGRPGSFGSCLWPHVSPEGSPGPAGSLLAPQGLPWELFVPLLSAWRREALGGSGSPTGSRDTPVAPDAHLGDLLARDPAAQALGSQPAGRADDAH